MLEDKVVTAHHFLSDDRGFKVVQTQHFILIYRSTMVIDGRDIVDGDIV